MNCQQFGTQNGSNSSEMLRVREDSILTKSLNFLAKTSDKFKVKSYLMLIGMLSFKSVYSEELTCSSQTLLRQQAHLNAFITKASSDVLSTDQKYNELKEETDSFLNKQGPSIGLAMTAIAVAYLGSRIADKYFSPFFENFLKKFPTFSKNEIAAGFYGADGKPMCTMIFKRLNRTGLYLSGTANGLIGLAPAVVAYLAYKGQQAPAMSTSKEANAMQNTIADNMSAVPESHGDLNSISMAIQNFESEVKNSNQILSELSTELRNKISLQTQPILVRNREKAVVERRLQLAKFNLLETQLKIAMILATALKEKCPDPATKNYQ